MIEDMDPRVGMVSREQTIDALTEIDEATKRQGIQVARCGGVAMQVYSSDRLTADIDVLVTRPPFAFHQGPPLGFGDYSATTSKGTKVDYIARNDEMADLYRSAFDAAQRVPGVLRSAVLRNSWRCSGLQRLAAMTDWTSC